jgi:hypothetical protein
MVGPTGDVSRACVAFRILFLCCLQQIDAIVKLGCRNFFLGRAITLEIATILHVTANILIRMISRDAELLQRLLRANRADDTWSRWNFGSILCHATDLMSRTSSQRDAENRRWQEPAALSDETWTLAQTLSILDGQLGTIHD